MVQLETTVYPLPERSVQLCAWTFYLGPDTSRPVHESMPMDFIFPAGKTDIKDRFRSMW